MNDLYFRIVRDGGGGVKVLKRTVDLYSLSLRPLYKYEN